MKWNSTNPFQALALSGGGYRGLFTAKALATMEQRRGRPIGQCFDLIAGTSIGGIIALAAAFEVEMDKVVCTFEKFGSDIFPIRPRSNTKLSTLLDAYRFRRRPKYSSEPLRSVINELIPAASILGDARHPVVIPAVNVTTGRPQVFKTKHLAQWDRDWRLNVTDIALATAAAPTFFPLAELHNNLYVDGGLFANAPDPIALHEAEFFLEVPVSAIRMLSIGTTMQSYSISPKVGREMGIIEWVATDNRLFNVIISAQQQFATQIIAHRLGPNYVRVDVSPSSEQATDLGLDVATEHARKILLGLAEKATTDILESRLSPYLNNQPQLKTIKET